MFIVYIWDNLIGESTEFLPDFIGNELFLMREKDTRFQILSELTNCDEELLTGEQISQLIKELTFITLEFSDNRNTTRYLNKLIVMSEKALLKKKAILFSPF